MKNVICIPFVYDDKKQSGVNVYGHEKLQIYLKNACVALVSAKKYNMECVVMLATNLTKEQIPKNITRVLKENEIEIYTIPFDRFCFSADYLWSLAFYKLCVLSHLSEMEYDNICYMDTDVYVQSSFENVWKECSQSLMLYDINHGLGTKDYQIICNEFAQFTGGDHCFITHYGGEFLATNLVNAKLFVEKAESIYKEMTDKKFVTTKGDEFIVSLTADQMKDNIKNAGAYIYRFWTGDNFRLVSTCYEYNAVTVLHLPTEKERGMLKIFSQYIEKSNMPTNLRVWKICRLMRQPILDIIKRKLRTILSKGRNNHV